MAQPGAVPDRVQCLSFLIGEQAYGVEILRVREILEFAPVTRVPGTPSCIRGVLNLRGSVVPVIDLSAKFGLGETQITRFTCIVLVDVEVEGRNTTMGVLVDSVKEVWEVSRGEIASPPTFGTQVKVEYLRGLARMDEVFVLLLDVDRVLSTNELHAAEATAALPAEPPA